MTDFAATASPRIWPLSRLGRPLEADRQFTPNWFAATMGTGILAICLAQFPMRSRALTGIAEGLWFFNIGLFSLFCCLYAARWVFFFDGARRIFDHSAMSMFFGCIPMGLATIVNGFLSFGLARWGHVAVDIAQALWWIDAALSLACGVLVPFFMFTRQTHAVEHMTAIWLLPVVPAEVAAVSAGLLAPHLADPQQQLFTLMSGYALWAFSVPIAMSVLVILILRMAVHKLPHNSMAASSWLALGPIGTGALGLLVLGGAAPAVFEGAGLGSYGPAAQGVGLVGGVLMWGYGLWWIAIACLITLRYLREGVPFNLGWWGYTFPLGVYTVATLRLSTLLPIPTLTYLGGALVLTLGAIWLIVGARTVAGAWTGALFVSPCLRD